MKIGTARDVRRLDESVITDYGIDQAVLMENAAIAGRDAVEQCWGILENNILVVCGVGNNGGDGFALARLLYARGAAVTIIVAGDTEKLSGAARSNYFTAKQLPLEVLQLDSSPNPALLSRIEFSDFDIIVDAIFGTGLSRNIEGRMETLVRAINAAETPVLSLDIPSGINADSGEILGCAVKADATVSFGIVKRGNLLYPGHDMGGRLYYSEISFPPEVCGDDRLQLTLNVPSPAAGRDPAGHKGSFGKVLIIGGSLYYRGAPALAAGAALRAGAGYARLAVPAEIVPQIFSLLPEAVFLPQEGNGSLGGEHLPDLTAQVSSADATVLGPGLSTAPESIRLARDLIPVAESPLIIDGDALGALAGREELTRERSFPTILTPHPGEMARLLGSSIREVEARRIEIAGEAAERYGCIVVLKGAHSVIAVPDGRTWLNLSGNSGMGTAGSGDVLAGLVAALVAESPDPLGAVRLGVHIHGFAGDLAAEDLGERGMIASDILEKIPAAFRLFPERIKENPYSGKIVRL